MIKISKNVVAMQRKLAEKTEAENVRNFCLYYEMRVSDGET